MQRFEEADVADRKDRAARVEFRHHLGRDEIPL